jgi:hypothetical protein
MGEADYSELIKTFGFTNTLKLLEKWTDKRRRPQGRMSTVMGGVLENLPSGLVDASLDTEDGPVVIRGGERTDIESNDPQLVLSNGNPLREDAALAGHRSPALLLTQIADGGADVACNLICEAELTRFDPAQRQVLMPLLWQYVLGHRNSNNRDELVATASAIRKYIAIMPMDRMGDLAALLEQGHRVPLPLELELEVAKMIYRNYEVHPPLELDPQPELASRLWEMAQAYLNPRILLRDKHSAVASLAIEAVVAMRSARAHDAWHAAVACEYRWFGEMVMDDLSELRDRWVNRNDAAVTWLDQLRERVTVEV